MAPGGSQHRVKTHIHSLRTLLISIVIQRKNKVQTDDTDYIVFLLLWQNTK